MRLWKGHTHRNCRPFFLSLGYPFLSGGYLWVFSMSIFSHCGHWGRHGPGVLRSESKNDLLSHSYLIKSGAGLWSAQLCPELPLGHVTCVKEIKHSTGHFMSTPMTGLRQERGEAGMGQHTGVSQVDTLDLGL